jgi:transglutaminase-like putative cysteine protease
MPQTYSVLTFVLAFTGCVSLIVSGELNPYLYIFSITCFPGYYRLLKGKPQAPKWIIGGFSVATLLIFLFDSFVISNDYFLAVSHLTILFQAIKSFDLREPWDHLQVYFMALLQLIIASELIYSILFGIIFIFFLVTFVSAIILAHFMKEGARKAISVRKPVVIISFLTLVVTVLFFIATPRVASGLWGKGHKKGLRTVGFSEKIEFGSFGDVKLDPTVVMRVELNRDMTGPLYWRGMSLNYFDGISWKDTKTERAWISRRDGRFTIHPFRQEDALVQRIYLEPMDTDVIFGLSEVAAIEASAAILFRDSSGSLFLPVKKNKSFQYTVYSTDEIPELHENIADYLQLYADVRNISRLAHDISDVYARDEDKAKAIEKNLRENYTYSLSPSLPSEGVSPIEHFLFHDKKGFCEHYATAMVLMLRSIGIPARIVTGFSGGELNEYGGYLIVRQSNAHSWVEAVTDGKWKVFDPTPPVMTQRPSTVDLYLDMLRMKWNRYVVGFSRADQKEIARVISLPFRLPSTYRYHLRSFAGIWYVMIFLFFLLLVFFSVRKLTFRRYGFVTGRYLRLIRMMKREGVDINPSTTPSEVKRAAMSLGLGSKVGEFIKLYLEYRFGSKEMHAEDRERYRKILKDIQKQR